MKPSINVIGPQVSPSWMSLPYLSLILVYIALGTTFGSIRIALFHLPPEVVVVWRFLLAAAVLLPLGVYFAQRQQVLLNWSWGRAGWNLCVGMLVFAVGNGVLCYPLQHISSGMAAGIVAFSPFFMLGLSRFIPPAEPLTKPVVQALLVGLLGMGVLIFGYQVAQGHTAGGLSIVQWQSMGLMMLVNMCWVSGSLMVRQQQQPLPQLCVDTALQCLVASGIFAVIAAVNGQSLNVLSFPPAAVWALLYLAWMGTCCGMLCYFYCLKTLPLALTGSFAYVTPMLTMILGVMFLDEPVSNLMWGGMVLILASVVLIHRVTRQRKQHLETSPAVIKGKIIDSVSEPVSASL